MSQNLFKSLLDTDLDTNWTLRGGAPKDEGDEISEMDIYAQNQRRLLKEKFLKQKWFYFFQECKKITEIDVICK
ncbi:hypothetical protein LguiA_014806 [Lonicera macranthoides]